MKRARQRSEQLFQQLETISTTGGHEDEDTENLLSIQSQTVLRATDTQKQPRMKKFRFQLLHRWLTENFPPAKAADIGGGKGLLSFLLAQSGWTMTVIDPVKQSLPPKYKDLEVGKRVRIATTQSVQHITAEFAPEQAAEFDFLIGMHAHGCNAKIIDSAAQYGCAFVLFPCCVIDEPFYPRLGVHWLEALADYAINKGHIIRPFRLNFKGQNIGLFGKKDLNIGHWDLPKFDL